MSKLVPCPVVIKAVAAAASCAILSACGGGTSTAPPISTPAPPPPPSPPAPPPPPPPTTNFDTAEFRRSDGPEFHNALTAWQAGITGSGSTIAVIDSGIDSDSPEFAGRIHPDSRDVAGNRGIDGVDDHGTNVAMVAAAARDNTGIVGIAFDARVLALRADDPGSCGTDTPQDPSLGCLFDDRSIAIGIDQAIASRAVVINISLGGGAATQVLLDAVRRAANAGVVVVVSAGNGGDGSEPGIDPNQPDPFASSLLAAGLGNVIIVGSVDENGAFSSFSNRAGRYAASFLAARGEAICCVYQNGQLFVETINGQQFVTLFSGTSFSAPQVAGAAALLKQAFPNLTGQQIVEILLNSARDAGASGTDAVFGRGILDIGAAMRPAGTTTLAGTATQLALFDDVAIGSAAMGDALQGQGLQTIILDRYSRAYGYDLSAAMRTVAAVTPRLENAVERRGRSVSVGNDAAALAFTVGDGPRGGGLEWSGPLRLSADEAQQAEMLAARVAFTLAPDTRIALALRQGAEGIMAQLQGRERPAFLIAPQAGGDVGFYRQGQFAVALRREFGTWGVTFHGESGDARIGALRRIGGTQLEVAERFPVASFGLAADRRLAGFDASLGLTWLKEGETVLGGYFNPALGGRGADTAFVDLALRRDLGVSWQAGASWRQGVTLPQGGGALAASSRLLSNAWSFDLSRAGFISKGDWMGLRVSQPLRVASGGLLLDLPVAYDYATGSARFARQLLNLAPDGREVITELAWRGPVLGGTASASLFHRREPGHFADLPADTGIALSFSAGF